MNIGHAFSACSMFMHVFSHFLSFFCHYLIIHVQTGSSMLSWLSSYAASRPQRMPGRLLQLRGQSGGFCCQQQAMTLWRLLLMLWILLQILLMRISLLGQQHKIVEEPPGLLGHLQLVRRLAEHQLPVGRLQVGELEMTGMR
jgi:hypothetical protein